MNQLFVFACGLAILGCSTKNSELMNTAAFLMMGAAIGKVVKDIEMGR